MMDKDDFYTIDEMAEKLKVSKDMIYQRIHQGQAGKAIPPYISSGGDIHFKVSDFEAWHNKLSQWRKNL